MMALRTSNDRLRAAFPYFCPNPMKKSNPLRPFGETIISWYHHNKRDLPWRGTKDPYKIWLSEIILQQTRVEQGTAYYHRFTETYPTVLALASAKEDAVLKLWQGLGYYSRARNLLFAAKQIKNEFAGKFPATYEEIKMLKGVGDYTAAAIASFAFNLPHAVVDGNVYRFLSRYFGIKTPINSTAGKKEFALLAQQLLMDHPPGDFNQALMEFGARQCKPSSPLCDSCPLQSSCFAYKHKTTGSLPVKDKKIKIRKRYFHYLIIKEDKHFYIRRREEKDIWTGLHDFPLIESVAKLSESELLSSDDWKSTFQKTKAVLKNVSEEYKHVLSHQHIYARFFEVHVSKPIEKKQSASWKKVNKLSIRKFAVPRLIEQYLEKM
jgi:A/G-specific adenine glycosylase